MPSSMQQLLQIDVKDHLRQLKYIRHQEIDQQGTAAADCQLNKRHHTSVAMTMNRSRRSVYFQRTWKRFFSSIASQTIIVV